MLGMPIFCTQAKLTEVHDRERTTRRPSVRVLALDSLFFLYFYLERSNGMKTMNQWNCLL
jgi:hypothetical protein